MDAKAVKTALKEARDAIKNKEYALSLKICKNILKSDKENYMALVFFGISMQEVGPREQAPHAFRKAIQANPDQTLAWNGLASFYEKDETDSASKELIPVYEKLLETERDVSKFNDLCTKVVMRALKIQETSKTCEILKSLASDDKNSENIRRTAWLALASLLSQSNNLNTELQNLFEVTLSTIVKDRSSVTSDFYKEYLKMLYKLKKFETLFNEAINMHSIYESTIYPLEWLCKIYVELSIEDDCLADKFDDQMHKYCEKMTLLQPDAVMAIFVAGVRLFRVGKYVESRDNLKKVVSLRSGLLHAWVLLSECYLKLYCYNDALQNATKADKLLQSLNKENARLRQKIDKIFMECLSKLDHVEKSENAIELGLKLLDNSPSDVDILVSLITAYINVSNVEKAKYYLERIKNENKIMYTLLNGKMVQQQGKLTEALAILQESNLESCEILIEIGTIYWKLQDYEASLVPYLKAAKLEPNYYMSFVYLGKYYERVNDLDKARRCFQKAFNINPKCMEAGIGLSNIYRMQKNWEANLALLQFVTGTNDSNTFQILNAEVRWAWLQLGLHYLEQEDYTKSIDCLRSVIRVDPNNGHYWECLADAYMARGSYTAAMKSYERAAELSEDTIYPKLQSATIKFMLGFHDEAKEAFENVLIENKRYVPALKGLAENCLAQAFSEQQNQLLGRSRANAQYAVEQLTIALKERSDLSCLWKLTGDSCALVADLPDKYSYLILEASLAEGRDSEELVPLDKQQLYALAARCYGKAITLTNTNILVWHDLATCYYSHACTLSNEVEKEEAERKQLLTYANAAIKHCVDDNPSNWEHWNLLGVIALHADVKNYPLAQHAFIKAVTIDKNCAVAWSNLATLYFMLNNVSLANKAYSQAQRADPNYVNSWIGQALIAETMGHDDAMDLFRHSTQLSYHPQSALGYANWVCKTITSTPSNAKLYSIRNMHAIPVALDALTWYTEHNPYNACAWNMLGILRERLQFRNSTLDAFKRALKLCDDENCDNVLINCARTLVALGKYDDAINMYRKIKVSTFNDGCGLALALYKAERYEESYEAYDTTMNWLAQNENMQSHVLVALAAMMYKFKGADVAKTLLFQSTQLKPPSQWGLYATLALGLIHGDLVMAQLVLKELQPMKDLPEIIYHYAILESLFYLRQDDVKGAIRSLVKSIHRHPGQAPLWQFLSVLLLRVDAKNSSKQAANCAQVSIKLNRSQKDITNILCLISLSSCVSNDLQSALKSAQKAVHCYPDAAQGWAVLIFVLKYQLTKQHIPTEAKQCEWLKNATNYVKKNLPLNEELTQWFSQLSF